MSDLSPLLPAQAGLCSRCRHARLKTAADHVYLYCALSASDPAFPRYPRLPVLACAGFHPAEEEKSGDR